MRSLEETGGAYSGSDLDAWTGDSPETFVLRRNGARPVQVHGVEVCSAVGDTGDGWLWYEIRIIRCVDGRFALAVSARKRAPRERDEHRLWFLSSFADCIAQLEAYDPQGDVPVLLDVSPDGVSEGALALQATDLRLRLSDAQRRFKTLLGELLYELDVHE